MQETNAVFAQLAAPSIYPSPLLASCSLFSQRVTRVSRVTALGREGATEVLLILGPSYPWLFSFGRNLTK